MEEITFNDVEDLNDKASPVKKRISDTILSKNEDNLFKDKEGSDDKPESENNKEPLDEKSKDLDLELNNETRIKNTDLNNDEPSIVLNKKVVEQSQIEQIKIPEELTKKPKFEKRPSTPVNKSPEFIEEKVSTPIKSVQEENMTEDELIQEYKYKFRMLKRNYSYIDMPAENSTIKEMKRAYDRALKEVSSDTNVQNYHMYLICGFFAVEYVSKNLLGLDLSGFTVDRIKRINRYNRLLIELGERSYTSVGSSWPVEVRLCIFIIVDAVIFYIVSKVVGGNSQLMDVIMNTISGAPSKSGDGGGGLGNIMNLFGQVMTGMNSAPKEPQQYQQPPQQSQQPPVSTKPYEMKPPRFMKKQ